MQNTIKLGFIEDPAHGWLLAPRELVEELGIADQVSRYSYLSRHNIVALEEDRDAGLLLRAIEARGLAAHIEHTSCDGDAPVRRWDSYPAAAPSEGRAFSWAG